MAPKDDLIPDEILKKMSELGVFSIAIPESYGGRYGQSCNVRCYRGTFRVFLLLVLWEREQKLLVN